MVYTSDHPFFYVTADVATFCVPRHGRLHVLLIRRGNPPYDGQLALPGGFVEPGEDLDAAARRELAEETGVDMAWLRLEELGAYGAPDRDPRHRVVSVSFLAVLPPEVAVVAGDDAVEAGWHPVDDVLADPDGLAFDHAKILTDAVRRLRSRIEGSDLALGLLAPEFTIAELREAYEAVWGRRLDPGNFQRKVTGLPGFLRPTGNRTSHGRGRPAALYTAGPNQAIWPPLSQTTEH